MIVKDFLVDLLFPPKCIFCRSLLKDKQTDFCESCRLTVSEIPSSFKRGRFFKECHALYYYEDNVAKSIRRYKFMDLRHYAHGYAKQLAMLVLQRKLTFDVLTYVPVSRSRLRKRGFDQSRLLAECLAKELGIKCVRCLKKIRDNPAQSSCRNEAERNANVLGMYRVCNAQQLRNKRVLLIDDVITTGATLSECSSVLLSSGAAEVRCLTVAATRKNKNSR